MTLGRIIRFSALFIILLSVWAYMNHVGQSMSQVREDPATRTRFLIRQAQSADSGTLARLAGRYRRPAEDLPPHPVDFAKLWPILRDGQPNSVTPADPASPVNDATTRQVVFQGKDESGRPVKVRVDWVRLEGKWYLDGYSDASEKAKESEPERSNLKPGGST
jgi:hypothetical protein